MTRAEFYESFDKRYAQLKATSERKNSDYCGSGEVEVDPFANFKSSPGIAKVTVEQGILVRMGDKLSRLGSLLDPRSTGPKVADESIIDTINDLICYGFILGAYRESVE
jgi:hypothetical protein